MQDIEMLNIINTNCNTVGTEKEEKGRNCNMRKDSILDAGSEKCCANTGPERSCDKTNSNTSCYTNSGSNTNLYNRLHNILRLMVNNNEIECCIQGLSTETNANVHGNLNFNNRLDNTPLLNKNEIEYFLPGPSKESDNKANTEITKQLQKEFQAVFTGIGCFDGTFSLQVKLDSKPYQVPPWNVAYALQKPFKEELERLPTAGYNNTIMHRGNGKMVKQLHICTKAQWQRKAMPRPRNTQPSTYKASP